MKYRRKKTQVFTKDFLELFLGVSLIFLIGSGVAYALGGNDSYTVLLLHANGIDAATSFEDVSASAHTVTANGNAQVDTAQSKFGDASALFDGSGDYLDIGTNSDFTYGTGDFTVDLWFRMNTVDNEPVFEQGQYNADGLLVRINEGASDQLAVYFDSVTPFTFSKTWATDTWYHLAVVRSGDNLLAFVDGTQLGSTQDVNGRTIDDDSVGVRVGGVLSGSTSGGDFDGWVDEVRISKGVARWTEDFTPPQQPYSSTGDSGQTTLSGNVLFASDVTILGSLSKGSGTFVIDHPLKPRTHLLYHSFVESPDVKNIYDGIVRLDENGEATIQLPSYFEALNRNFRYQFFPLDEPMPGLYIKQGVTNNHFTIAGGEPDGKVSWQVTGIRHDPYILANPIVPEVEKGSGEIADKGECIFKPLCQ